MTRPTTTPNLSRAERPDIHGLRCEFRRLTNQGVLLASQYDKFVAWADANGGLYEALRNIKSYGEIKLA